MRNIVDTRLRVYWSYLSFYFYCIRRIMKCQLINDYDIGVVQIVGKFTYSRLKFVS